MYVSEDNGIKCVCVVTDEGNRTVEILTVTGHLAGKAENVIYTGAKVGNTY